MSSGPRRGPRRGPAGAASPVYHGGSNGTGFRYYAEFDRKQGRGIVIMTNAIGGKELWQRVIAAVADP